MRFGAAELSSDESNALRRLAPAPLKNRKLLSKTLSMRETSLEAAWERRRLQFLMKKNGSFESGDDESTGGFRSPRFTDRSLTDEDLNELKGSIDLGFGFNEEDGQELCETLPALDLYFAVTRQLSMSSSPPSLVSSPSVSVSSSVLGSPKSPDETWRICSPGDNPQHVKTRLRHWAQAVACSVRQSSQCE